MDIQQKIEEITRLSGIWYKHISFDYYKDWDCHWEIKLKWSYGHTPYWSIVHDGDYFKKVNQEFSTYEEAIDGLLEIINEAIIKEQSYAQEVLKNRNEWDSEQIRRAEFILDI